MKLFDIIFSSNKIESKYVIIGVIETNKEKQLIGLDIESIKNLSLYEQRIIHLLLKKIRKPYKKKWLNSNLISDLWKLYEELIIFPHIYIKNKYCIVSYPHLNINKHSDLFEPVFYIVNKENDYIIRPLCKFDINYPIINDDILICSIDKLEYTDDWYPLPCNNINIFLIESYIIPLSKFKLHRLLL